MREDSEPYLLIRALLNCLCTVLLVLLHALLMTADVLLILIHAHTAYMRCFAHVADVLLRWRLLHALLFEGRRVDR